ncbi:MAG: cytochrome c [SAR324 cluster bacterium]|uniref:Cytochrome c domain-containing protein n=1 Tax=marine metagenome TaxID=408172 RepID=A0A381RUR6_9ZZZZ|nr:cytochrome c [SAR324 cluster bacterium]MDP7583714.1 cytochrome c [SAR324 cluster bacterium]
MKLITQICVSSFFFVFLSSSSIMAETLEEDFKIEGIITIASIKALQSELPKKLDLKIIDLNLKKTDSGWPVLRVQYNSDLITKDKIETAIGEIEDPAGHFYKVHNGPLITNAELSEEEIQAMSVMGDVVGISEVKNPTVDFEASVNRGEDMFKKNCAKCHGLNGNGYGVVANGFTTWPKQLWTWNGADSGADGYLFWIIENGKSDMPPWGLILSEDKRWDLINYIKTIKKPEGI